MKSDSQVQKDVMDQLTWEPILNASQIGVAVTNGIVTISGTVDSYAKKIAAENATKKVAGVKALVQEIEVGFPHGAIKTDAEIAEAVLNALKWNTMLPEEKIKIKVEDACVRLEGQVEWEYERALAKSAVENLTGVRSVLNLLTIKPSTTSYDVQQKIRAAFKRSATIDAEKISAEVSGSTVILRGTVRSLAEKEDAEYAASSAPGITAVESHLEIQLPEYDYAG